MCVVYLLSEQTKLRQLGGRFLLEKKGKRQASIPMDEVECVIQGKAAEITADSERRLLLIVPMCAVCEAKTWMAGKPMEESNPFCLIV